MFPPGTRYLPALRAIGRQRRRAIAPVINEGQKGVSVLALSFSRYVSLAGNSICLPLANSIFARKAGNRYEWPSFLSFPSVLSHHIGAKNEHRSPDPGHSYWMKTDRKTMGFYNRTAFNVLLSNTCHVVAHIERHEEPHIEWPSRPYIECRFAAHIDINLSQDK